MGKCRIQRVFVCQQNRLAENPELDFESAIRAYIIPAALETCACPLLSQKVDQVQPLTYTQKSHFLTS
jgi:hypothetical protein